LWISDGELLVRTPPDTPRSGEFRKNGTIRRFTGPYHAPTGILPA
jgi:hypothetical protein